MYDGSDLIPRLESQFRALQRQFAHVPYEFAGDCVSCARFKRLIDNEIGNGLNANRDNTYSAYAIFGIPLVEDPEVPDGQIRIRYRSGEEKVFYLE